MNKRKMLIFILLLVFMSKIFIMADTTSDPVNSNNTVKKYNKIKLSKFDIYRIAYWSTYGATGVNAFINTFAQLGYSYTIAQRMESLSKNLKSYDQNVGILPTLATYYPLMVFGSHFIGGGLACIPMVGGVAYGTALYIVGIAFSVNSIKPLAPFDLRISNDYSTQQEELQQIYNDVFSPVPYYAVGTVSILFGVGEIVTTLLYLKEKDKKRYPYMQKIFTFNACPTSFFMTIKLDI